MADAPPICTDPAMRAACIASTVDALRRLEGKWKLTILCQLFTSDTLRFSELERAIEGITQKMLIQQLKELEKDGLVLRTLFPQVPPRVEYSLTDFGRALAPAISALKDWAEAGPQGAGRRVDEHRLMEQA
ncbi:HxlR family transcriptional regulator [Sphingobium sp. 22B]|uniref:winged helix-turn-helix transcriptional regulator n=1 Tax=unclassified Sphingobium TaxID=2611147 RepID=UPI0007863004|nr:MULTISPECIES: helix-turn-helix domain-containing protein [unclassified Sphingobium]KXU33807.1 HxlR family transcriptional regulator [Sphingobium sp. AM]KYC33752.1 HxlR family transcriptional regulator [Sphingobium sp. 22B]OAP33490.1 HxlR family transcriptional regulator [Sphingobium sp. 20006FA]